MTLNNKQTSKRLFVGSLPYKFTEGELLSLFISEGKVISVRIMHTRWGKSRGMGYVEFENEADAVRAKEKYHNYIIQDRSIIVDYAEPDPFLTPEGIARHEEAMERRNKGKRKQFRPQAPQNSQPSTRSSFGGSKYFDKEGFQPRRSNTSRPGQNRNSQGGSETRFKSTKHVRQSLFESRNFGSKPGAKFASRTRMKKNRK